MSAPRGPLLRYSGWVLLGLYLGLAGITLPLQFAMGTQFMAEGPPELRNLLGVAANGVWSVVGALLIARQPRNPIGWLFSAIPLLGILDDGTAVYAHYGYTLHPGSLPGVEAAIIWQYVSGTVLSLVPYTFLFSLFPTGEPLSERWGRLNWVVVGAAGVYILTAALQPLPLLQIPFPKDLLAARLGFAGRLPAFIAPLTWTAYFAMFASLGAAFASFFVRLSRARGVERLQLMWYAYSMAFSIPGFVLVIAGVWGDDARANTLFTLGAWLLNTSTAVVAIASAIAILRYRLWDINLLIRRTLIYATLSSLLAATYFVCVLVLQAAFQALTGESRSGLVTVLSTLAIAALFLPVRRRVQTAIDRRFYRLKYDAARTLALFAARARDETDLERLSKQLIEAASSAVQPAHASLWLRSPAGQGRSRPRLGV